MAVVAVLLASGCDEYAVKNHTTLCSSSLILGRLSSSARPPHSPPCGFV